MDMKDNSGGGHVSNINAPVEEKEGGQKLLRFLERRLKLPTSLLHRWIRTGQIRINGSRCKPFDRVEAGDLVRLPPFALSMAEDLSEDLAPERDAARDADNFVEILDIWSDIWALNKPAGLPVQSGTGHEDSVSARLAARSADDFFKPAPAHRLDRDTSGVLLAGASFEALRNLQEEFRDGKIHKEYLAWVKGKWPDKKLKLLKNYLRKEKENEKTRMKILPGAAPYAREALTLVKPLVIEDDKSLLHIRILTGVTHQIRAQLAHRGYPVLGDGKYGQGGGPLRLHSFRIILPDKHQFSVMPTWEGGFAPGQAPDPILPNLAGAEGISALPEFAKK